MAEIVPDELYRAAVKLITNSAMSGLYSEGVSLTLLEDNGVPIVRSAEMGPCDAAILLDDDWDHEKTLLGRLYKCTDENALVVAFDNKLANVRKGYAWSVKASNKEQKRLAQFILVEVGGCPLARIILPQALFSFTRAIRCGLAGAYASRMPSILASCVVRCEDLPEAFKRIRACAKDSTEPYVSPTTHTRFESGMFKSVRAQDALVPKDDSEQRQRRMLYDEMRKHGYVLDAQPIPGVVSDFFIEIDGNRVPVEAKVNCYYVASADQKLKHAVNRRFSVRSPDARRLFHHTQVFEYLYTQSETRKEAYILPQSMLPDSWYASATWIDDVSLSTISRFRIDLSLEDWGLKLVDIIRQTRHQAFKQREVHPRQFSITESTGDDFIDDVTEDEDDDVMGVEVTDISSKVKNAEIHMRVYFQLLQLCAHSGFGLILPFDQCPTSLQDDHRFQGAGRSSYVMIHYRWSPNDIDNFMRDRTLPPRSLYQCDTHTLVIPITILHRVLRFKASRGHFKLTEFSRLAQPFRQLVILADDFEHVTNELAVIPSEYFLPKKEGLERLVQRLDSGNSNNGIRFLDTLKELQVQYMHQIKDIPEVILSFLGFEGGLDLSSRAVSQVADRSEYVLFYKDLVQYQADNLFEAVKLGGTALDEAGDDEDDGDD